MKNFILLIFTILFAFNTTAQISDSISTTNWDEIAELASIKTQNYFENLSILREIDKEIFDSNLGDKELTVTIEDLLLFYRLGYVDGSLSFLEKGSFDFHILLSNIKGQKEATLSHRNYLKTKNKPNQ